MRLRECTLMDCLMVCCDLRDDEWGQVVAFGGARDIDALAVNCHMQPGAKWTFEAGDGKALVVGGFIQHRAGVFSSWFLSSAAAWREHSTEITTMTAERVQYALANGAHRIETVCLASRTRAHRWYEKVGLTKESTLKGYCVDGSDAVLYVALKGSG